MPYVFAVIALTCAFWCGLTVGQKIASTPDPAPNLPQDYHDAMRLHEAAGNLLRALESNRAN